MWREEDRWTTQDELLAVLVEQNSQWFRAVVGALLHQKRIKVPGVIEIPRPGQERKPKGKVVRSLAELARWFARKA